MQYIMYCMGLILGAGPGNPGTEVHSLAPENATLQIRRHTIHCAHLVIMHNPIFSFPSHFLLELAIWRVFR